MKPINLYSSLVHGPEAGQPGGDSLGKKPCHLNNGASRALQHVSIR